MEQKPKFISKGVTRGQKNVVLEDKLPNELRHKKVVTSIQELEE